MEGDGHKLAEDAARHGCSWAEATVERHGRYEMKPALFTNVLRVWNCDGACKSVAAYSELWVQLSVATCETGREAEKKMLSV